MNVDQSQRSVDDDHYTIAGDIKPSDNVNNDSKTAKNNLADNIDDVPYSMEELLKIATTTANTGDKICYESVNYHNSSYHNSSYRTDYSNPTRGRYGEYDNTQCNTQRNTQYNTNWGDAQWTDDSDESDNSDEPEQGSITKLRVDISQLMASINRLIVNSGDSKLTRILVNQHAIMGKLDAIYEAQTVSFAQLKDDNAKILASLGKNNVI
jgi:hypothetical protein